MISDKLRLDGDSLISIIVKRGSIDESEKYFKALTGLLHDKFYPELTGYLEKVNPTKIVEECKTIDELEKLDFPCTPPDFPTKLAQELDKLGELTDEERLFAFYRVFDILMGGSFNYVRQVMQQRANIILKQSKGRKIITDI